MMSNNEFNVQQKHDKIGKNCFISNLDIVKMLKTIELIKLRVLICFGYFYYYYFLLLFSSVDGFHLTAGCWRLTCALFVDGDSPYHYPP